MPHRYTHVNTSFPPLEDDGSENGTIRQNEKILAGAEIGRSHFWMKKTKEILTRIGAKDHDRSAYDFNYVLFSLRARNCFHSVLFHDFVFKNFHAFLRRQILT